MSRHTVKSLVATVLTAICFGAASATVAAAVPSVTGPAAAAAAPALASGNNGNPWG